MAESSQNLEENSPLTAYHEALQCYERLESIFHQPQYLLNTLKLDLINVCAEKVQNLINIETEGEFDVDISHALFLLRQHLVYLKKPKCTLPVNSPVANTVKTTQLLNKNNNPQAQAKKSNEDEELQGIIKATQTVPRVSGLKDIGGLADVKKSLAAIVVLPIHQPQLYVGRKISNTILLYGPPGTGKTQLAHALAAEASATLFSVAASDILSQYVGQTEKLVRTLFKTVKEEQNCTTILFMDEIDGLCRSRNTNESEWNRRLKTELMCQLSAFEHHPKVFLICATNCPWDLDTAFLRRFQRRIYVPLPTRSDRFELLQLLTKDTALEITSNYWGDLLTKTEGYSGSDLADLVRYSLNIPITELMSNNRWERVGMDIIYQPASDFVNYEKVIYCELRDLPPRSVQARQVQVKDLMAAVDVVKKTVSDATIQKYVKYLSEA